MYRATLGVGGRSTISGVFSVQGWKMTIKYNRDDVRHVIRKLGDRFTLASIGKVLGVSAVVRDVRAGEPLPARAVPREHLRARGCGQPQGSQHLAEAPQGGWRAAPTARHRARVSEHRSTFNAQPRPVAPGWGCGILAHRPNIRMKTNLGCGAAPGVPSKPRAEEFSNWGLDRMGDWGEIGGR